MKKLVVIKVSERCYKTYIEGQPKINGFGNTKQEATSNFFLNQNIGDPFDILTYLDAIIDLT